MDKEFYTKYSNDLDCVFCSWLTECKDGDKPVCVGGLLKHYKDQVKVLEKALMLACDTAQFEDTCVFCAYRKELEETKQCPCYCESEQNFFTTQAVYYYKNKAKEELNK